MGLTRKVEEIRYSSTATVDSMELKDRHTKDANLD